MSPRRAFFLPALLLPLLLVVAIPPGAVLQAQELEWVTSAGGVRDDAGLGIATDALGNSYVTGAFQETAIFGEGEVNETVLTEVGANDIFVAKYAPDGTLLWATSAGGAGTDVGDSIATDALGNISVAGTFQDRATFGAGEANETVVSTQDPSFNGVFVARYAPDGTLLWATSARGIDTGTADGRGIATDALGNSYVTGGFSQMAIFGEGEVNETVLTRTRASPFSGGLFVAKYAPDGTLLWGHERWRRGGRCCRKLGNRDGRPWQ